MSIFRFSNAGGFGTYQRYNDFLAGNPAVIQDNGSYFPLGEFTLASAQSSVTFDNIPQTYTHLQLRMLVRTASTTQDYVIYKPNNANLSARHFLSGDGATASAGASTTVYDFGQIPKSDSTASSYGVFVLDILDYRNTNKVKTLRQLGGVDLNGSGNVALTSGLYNATTAITSLVITTFNSTNYATNSQFALYGVLA